MVIPIYKEMPFIYQYIYHLYIYQYIKNFKAKYIKFKNSKIMSKRKKTTQTQIYIAALNQNQRISMAYKGKDKTFPL